MDWLFWLISFTIIIGIAAAIGWFASWIFRRNIVIGTVVGVIAALILIPLLWGNITAGLITWNINRVAQVDAAYAQAAQSNPTPQPAAASQPNPAPASGAQAVAIVVPRDQAQAVVVFKTNENKATITPHPSAGANQNGWVIRCNGSCTTPLPAGACVDFDPRSANITGDKAWTIIDNSSNPPIRARTYLTGPGSIHASVITVYYTPCGQQF